MWGFTEKSDFFREGQAVFRIKGEGRGMEKKRGCSVSLILEDGACYDDITKSVDFQTNINFFSKWLYNCRNSTKKPYDFRLRILGNKKVFEKTEIGWRQILVAIELTMIKLLQHKDTRINYDQTAATQRKFI